MDGITSERPSKGQKLVLVTGPSGAGRTTAVNVLEDIGYEVIDNLPLSLVDRVLAGPPLNHPLALGIDVRNRDFSLEAVLRLMDTLVEDDRFELEVLYLDCRADILIRRYSETRRRHPMAPTETPELGIERELDLIDPVKERADVVIDTSELSHHDLKSEIKTWLSVSKEKNLAISVHSFSYKRGVPRGLDLVFDARFLRNPHWDKSLRELDGRDAWVKTYISEDERFIEFFKKVFELVEFLIPAYEQEGKSHLSIGFGCSGGQHRSVALTELVSKTLVNSGRQVSVRHRELERRTVKQAAWVMGN